jgi:ABC-type multidrug transport system fused ATPase/permease subunit
MATDWSHTMVIAADWQVGQVFFSLLWFALFFIWIWLLFMVFADLFRDHKLSGWWKALWVIFIIVMPFLGVLVYVIARGGSMAERAAAQVRQDEQDFQQYVRSAAGSGSTADELERLDDLRKQGVISDDEFQQLKAKALAGT